MESFWVKLSIMFNFLLKAESNDLIKFIQIISIGILSALAVLKVHALFNAKIRFYSYFYITCIKYKFLELKL